MSMPLENHRPRIPPEDVLIDQLVDGELPDAERRELLRRLEGEPDGWRRCALAFLEAQCWRDAFRPPAVAAHERPRPLARLNPARKRGRVWQPVARLTALAASLAAAFALGWASHGTPEASVADGSVARPGPTASAEPPPPTPAEPAAPTDPFIKEWEKRGFHAERQRRVVWVELKDGRRIDVPVQEVRLEHVRGRSY
jgi:hypothetical protein